MKLGINWKNRVGERTLIQDSANQILKRERKEMIGGNMGKEIDRANQILKKESNGTKRENMEKGLQ